MQENAFIHFIPCTVYIIVSSGVHVSWSQDRCTYSGDVRMIPVTGTIIACKTSLCFRVFTNLESLSTGSVILLILVIMDHCDIIHVDHICLGYWLLLTCSNVIQSTGQC